MLKKVAADFCGPSAAVRDHQWFQKRRLYPGALKTAGVGWLGMIVPEEFGGGATSYRLRCGVRRACRGPLPGPRPCGVLAAQIVLEGGSDAQKIVVAGFAAAARLSSPPSPMIRFNGGRARADRLTQTAAGFALSGNSASSSTPCRDQLPSATRWSAACACPGGPQAPRVSVNRFLAS
jgi:alkylation response protein AidB-like acyl-CoA dehydrogenase